MIKSVQNDIEIVVSATFSQSPAMQIPKQRHIVCLIWTIVVFFTLAFVKGLIQENRRSFVLRHMVGIGTEAD